MFPNILVTEVSTGSHLSIDSSRAICIDLMSHHHLFLKALIYLKQHTMNTILVPSDLGFFSPVSVIESASLPILLCGLPIVHLTACISLKVHHSRQTQCVKAASRWMYGHHSIAWGKSFTVRLQSASSQTAMIRGYVPTLFMLFFFFCPWRLLAASKEVYSLYLRNNKILLTLITVLPSWNPF